MKEKTKKVTQLLDEVNIKEFIESITVMRQEMLSDVDDDEEVEAELVVPIATIDNLLDLLDGVKNIENTEPHHGVAIIAHVQLLRAILDGEMDQDYEDSDPDFEDNEPIEIEKKQIAVKKTPKTQKAPAKKNSKRS